MKITWNTDSIKALTPEMNTLLSNFNCEVVVDRYGASPNCRDRAGSTVSWNVLEANGLVYLLNRTILHPCGYSLYLRDGVSPGFFVMEDDELKYSLDTIRHYERILSSTLEGEYLNHSD